MVYNLLNKKTMNLTEREEIFKNEVEKFTEYEQKLRDQFFNYWSEPNIKKTKMRFELEKTWDIKRRLKTFFDNQNKWNASSNNSSTERRGTSEARVAALKNW